LQATLGEKERAPWGEGEPPHASWSKARREVYGELSGEIWIWDWDNGKLKRRVRYAKFSSKDAIFSPDGKWLLAVEQMPKGNDFLRRYDVQRENMGVFVDQAPAFDALGFSPDGRFLWFVRQNSMGKPVSFHIAPNTGFKINWSLVRSHKCFGASKWLPDGLIGIVQEKGFSWRDASGREIGHLPGPFGTISDWTLSPDGNWIVSVERSGIIRRWRAR